MAKRDRVLPVDAHRPVSWNEAAVQRCLDRAGYVLAQVKEDGIRFHAWLDPVDDSVCITTREGIEILSLATAKKALCGLLQALPACFIVDGEVTVPGVTFEEASGHLRRHSEIELPVQFYVWDAMPIDVMVGTHVYSVAYEDRLHTLILANTRCKDEPSVEIIDTETCHSMRELQAWFELQRSRGKEGLVAKDPELIVRNGKVTGQWKMKPSDTEDGRVVGYVWGTPGLGNAGKIVGFTVELESGVLCDATGLTQEQMTEFTAEYTRMAKVASMAGPFAYKGRYCEVAYMEKTANGSLRHPSFVQFRDLDYAQGIKA